MERDRSKEFVAGAEEREAILASLRALTSTVSERVQRLDPETLGRPVMPSQALFGTGTPQEMTSRGAIVENIRHLGIHLGELRLTRSLLEARSAGIPA